MVAVLEIGKAKAEILPGFTSTPTPGSAWSLVRLDCRGFVHVRKQSDVRFGIAAGGLSPLVRRSSGTSRVTRVALELSYTWHHRIISFDGRFFAAATGPCDRRGLAGHRVDHRDTGVTVKGCGERGLPMAMTWNRL